MDSIINFIIGSINSIINSPLDASYIMPMYPTTPNNPYSLYLYQNYFLWYQ